MTTSRDIGLAFALALALALGCGGGGIGNPDVDGGLPDADLSDAPDLSRASWEIEPVEGSGDSGFDPKMSFDDEGRALVVWQKNDASAVGFGVRETDGTWNVQFISPPEATATFSPDVAGGANGTAHIVFAGSTADTGEDIFYVHWDGSALSQATNLTSAGQASNDTDFSPAVAVTPEGKVSVFYSYQTDPMGFGIAELRALSFTDPGAAGAPDMLFSSTDDCSQARARADGDGNTYAVTLCSGGGDHVEYVTDRSGKLEKQSADFSAADGMVAPDLDVDSRGAPHITVQGFVTCGGSSCSDPFYSVNLAPATPVTGAVDNYFSPNLALDAYDRPIIVFFDLPDRNLLWTFRDQAGFFRPQQVAPTADKVIGTGDTDPASGLPWFTFEDRTGAADVIWIARLVP